MGCGELRSGGFFTSQCFELGFDCSPEFPIGFSFREFSERIGEQIETGRGSADLLGWIRCRCVGMGQMRLS